MPTDLSITAFVNQHLAGGTFSLAASEATGGARDLIESWLPGATLVLTSASVTQTGVRGQLTIQLAAGQAIPDKGPLSVLGKTASLDALAEFEGTPSALDLRLTLSLPSTWKPSDTFPELLNSNPDELRLPDEPVLFDALDWSAARFILSSTSAAGFQQGLNLTAQIAPDGILAGPVGLLSPSGAVAISGTATLDGQGVTKILLTAAGTVPVSVGPLTARFGLTLSATRGAASDPIEATGEFDVSLAAAKAGLSLDLRATLFRGSRLLSFAVEPAQGAPFGLPDLQTLANGADLAAALPPGFDPGASLTLANLTLVIDTGIPTVSSITFALASSRSWRIFDQLTLSQITLRFVVNNPGDGATRSVEAAIDGTLSLGSGAEIEVGAQAPAYEIFATLPPDKTLSLQAALNSLLPTTLQIPAGVPDIVFSELNLNAFPTDRSLTFHAIGNAGTPGGWQILASPRIAITEIEADFFVVRTAAGAAVSGSIGGTVAFGAKAAFQVSAAFGEDLVLTGTYEPDPGDAATLADFLGALGIPVANDDVFNVSVTELDFTASPKLQTLQLHAALSNVATAHFGSSTLSLSSLTFDVARVPQTPIGVKVEGRLQLDTLAPFDFSAERVTGTSSGWLLHGEVDDFAIASVVSLGVVQQRVGDIQLPSSLSGLTIAKLAVGLDTSSGAFSFEGRLAPWRIPVDTGAITIDAGLTIDSKRAETSVKSGRTKRDFTAEVTGSVSFDGFGEIEFFQHFQMSAGFRMEPSQRTIDLTLQLGAFQLEADFNTASKQITFVIGTATGSTLTIGKLLSAMAQLIDPTIDEVGLDDPWDALLDIEIPTLTFVLDLEQTDTKSRSFSAELEFNQTHDFAVVSFQSISLTYAKGGTPAKTSITIAFKNANGDPVGPIVDALDPDPSAAGAGNQPSFDLRYLALGQHVTLTGLADLTTIQQIMTALQDGVKQLPPADRSKNPLNSTQTSLVFSADSVLFIAAQFSAAKMLDMSVIFNDPVVYGVRIALSGEKAKKLAGLEFEILYRRISDTLGVYHTELVLPDAIRQLEFGAVSVTLPIIALDIYTNGDFKIDVGFPWNGNFDRSCAVQVLPFTGAGGFYFNKLSASTATSVPVITIGSFSPVLEFGIGVRAGLGKRFEKGPLVAELSISIQCILEGVIAFFNPAVPGRTGQYYRIQGSVSIIGRIFGSVDFEVIKVAVEVVASITVQFRVEAYKPIVLVLEAEVSVTASLTVLFITIHFSFSLSVSQRIELPALEKGSPPWLVAIGGGSDRAQLRSSLADSQVARRVPLGAPVWRSVQFWKDKVSLDLRFHLSFTRDSSEAKAVALLVIPNSIPVDAIGSGGHDEAATTTDSAFDALAQALLAWAVRCHQTVDADAATAIRLEDLIVLPGELDALFQELLQPQPENFTDVLIAFLSANFNLNVTAAASRISGTAFPVLPNAPIVTVPAAPALSDAQQSVITAHRRNAFRDYFILLMRSLAQFARDLEDTLNIERALKQATAANLNVPGLLQANQPVFADTADPVALSAATNLSPDAWRRLIAAQPKTSDNDTLAGVIGRLNALLPVGTDDIALAIADSHVFLTGASLNTATGSAGAFVIATDQSLRDAVLTLNPPNGGFPLLELLFRLNKGGELSHLAGMASRYLLHGLQIADGDVDHALYQATGQQFALPGTESALREFRVQFGNPPDAVQVSAVDALDYIEESILGAEFPVAPTLLTLLPERTTDSLDRFYANQPRSFTNSHSLPWKFSATESFKVVEMSQALRLYLSSKTDGVRLNLGLEPAALGEIARTISDFAWATKVDVKIRAISASDGSGAAPDIFALIGVGEDDRSLLSGLASGSFTGAVFLLQQDDKGLNALSTALALRTVAGGVGANSASLTDQTAFLSLVVEASTAAEGYYVRVSPALGNQPPETLVLLAIQGGVTATQVDPGLARGTHNCIVIRESTASGDVPVIATAPDTVRVFTGKPGHTGFRVERDDDSLRRVSPKVTAVLRAAPRDDAAPRPLPIVPPVFNVVEQIGEWLHVVSSTLNAFVKAVDTFAVSELSGTIRPGGVVRAEAKSDAAAVSVAAGALLTINGRSEDGAFLKVTGDASVQGFVAKADFVRAAPSRELGNLYQILRYEIVTSPQSAISAISIAPDQPGVETPGLTWSYDTTGVTVGPADHDASVDAGVGRWVYERTVPVYRLFPPAATNSDVLPALNPYLGVEDGSTVKLRFSWNDVFGNEAAGTFVDHTFPIQYFDPLLAIGEWPLLTISYSFTAGDSPKIQFAFGLNDSALAKKGVADIVKILGQYRLAIYQLQCGSVDVTAGTSLGTLTGTGLKQKLLDFANDAHAYILAIFKKFATLPRPPQALFELAVAVPVQREDLVFAVTADLTLIRTKDALLNSLLAASEPRIKSVTTAISPKIPFTESEAAHVSPLSALKEFATGFSGAFPGLRLAASGTDFNQKNAVDLTLWALQFGPGGLDHKILDISANAPVFFSTAPLSNTLVSGVATLDVYQPGQGRTGAELKRFDSVDLNVAGRELLVGVEELLAPDLIGRLLQSGSDAVRTAVDSAFQSLLASKQDLADAICADLVSILTPPSEVALPPATIAADVLRPVLKANLVEGYDIELVAVVPAQTTNKFAASPILRIQPEVAAVRATGTGQAIDPPDFDFTLSASLVPLQSDSSAPSSSPVAFLVDTRTPEKCSARELLVRYHRIAIQTDLPGRGRTWLTFVPDTNAPAPSTSPLPLPVPLRAYPIAPSLIAQAAEADPQSVKSLSQVRQWDYTFTYAHLDAGQDTIEAQVAINADEFGTGAAGGFGGSNDLAAALLNFASVYPSAKLDLRAAIAQKSEERTSSLLAYLTGLIGVAATAWKNRSRTPVQSSVEPAHSFEINERPAADGVAVQVTTLSGTTPTVRPAATGRDNQDVRTVVIPGFDVVNQQHATAAVFLTRNKNLIGTWISSSELSVFHGWSVNPAFIFRTPDVRFANRLTPLLENNTAWDAVALKSAADTDNSLRAHLGRMLRALLPAEVSHSFSVRVTCSYAFTLAAGNGESDLTATHPVLLGPQSALTNSAQAATFQQGLVQNIANGIERWERENLTDNFSGMYVLSFSFFSTPGIAGSAPSPLLKVTNVRLKLAAIAR